jgi:predicted metal-dependent hydrolase
VQLRLPWVRSEPAPRRETRRLSIEGETVELAVVRHRLARRYVVRVADDGSVRLTVPRGASIAGGVRFAERQMAWIVRERARMREARAPWQPGRPIWFRGEVVRIEVAPGVVSVGPERIPVRGPALDVRAAVESHLRALATRELPARCLALATEVGLAVRRVSVRDQRSRWGACSSRGAITLNWRLVQMPPAVSDYVIFHELMHLRQPNHSRKFWREVDAVCRGWRDAERWLRRHGREVL